VRGWAARKEREQSSDVVRSDTEPLASHQLPHQRHLTSPHSAAPLPPPLQPCPFSTPVHSIHPIIPWLHSPPKAEVTVDRIPSIHHLPCTERVMPHTRAPFPPHSSFLFD
jgi:hypothetical protein